MGETRKVSAGPPPSPPFSNYWKQLISGWSQMYILYRYTCHMYRYIYIHIHIYMYIYTYVYMYLTEPPLPANSVNRVSNYFRLAPSHQPVQ